MTKQAHLSYDGGNIVVPVRIDQDDFDEANPPKDLTGAFLALPPSNPEIRFPPQTCSLQFVGTTQIYDCVLTGSGSKFRLTKR
jgi:hypothetical protein